MLRRGPAGRAGRACCALAVPNAIVRVAAPAAAPISPGIRIGSKYTSTRRTRQPDEGLRVLFPYGCSAALFDSRHGGIPRHSGAAGLGQRTPVDERELGEPARHRHVVL